MSVGCMLLLPASRWKRSRRHRRGRGGLEAAPRRHIVGTLDGSLAAEKRPKPKQKRLALFANLLFFSGEPDRDRTCDNLIKSPPQVSFLTL